MGSNRRRFLELIAAAGAVSVAGCSGGGGDGEDGGSSDETGGGESDGDDGSSDDTDTSGAESGEDDGNSETSDGGDTDSEDSSEDDRSSDDDGGDTDGGDTGSDGEIQPGDITGTAQSSVDGLEVVDHEVTAVDLQLRIELELRNVGSDNSIALTHHSIESKLFDADGNEVLREQSGTRGPDTSPRSGESGVVEIFLLPEQGTEPASYGITVSCDGVEYTGFTYCEGE